PLPRWALGVYWRTDGVPIWRDLSLIADEQRSYRFSAAGARALATALARRLAIHPGHVIAAYEDVSLVALQEQQVPVNVDPLASALDDPDERRRLAPPPRRPARRPPRHVPP